MQWILSIFTLYPNSLHSHSLQNSFHTAISFLLIFLLLPIFSFVLLPIFLLLFLLHPTFSFSSSSSFTSSVLIIPQLMVELYAWLPFSILGFLPSWRMSRPYICHHNSRDYRYAIDPLGSENCFSITSDSDSLSTPLQWTVLESSRGLLH